MLVSPVILVILDGWGVSRQRLGNATTEASTPTLDSLAAFHPSLTLQAAGFSVGMLWGEPGNSASGNTTIGAGRIMYNHLPRILREVRDGNFFENPILKGAAAHARQYKSRLHLVGLVSGASAHSYIDHLYALFDFVLQERASDVALHVITDGRDAPPQRADRIVDELSRRIAGRGYPVHIASVIGRYYAMDREENWDRTQTAYELLVAGKAAHVSDALTHIREAYLKDLTDETVPPAVCGDEGLAYRIRSNDAVIFFNFREDGMRQLARAFSPGEFSYFDRGLPQNMYLAMFTRYDENLEAGIVFPQEPTQNILPEILSLHGVKQLRIAESVKRAQVTYLFNGGRETPFRFEDHTVFPSDESMRSAENPSMRADDIAAEAIRALERTAHEFILVNFANADALAHTGDYAATMRGVEAVDRALGRIYERIMHRRGALIITADHGSAEEMVNIRTGEIKTGHSENPVPFFFITPRNRFRTMRSEKDIERWHAQPLGTLADIAPTVLELLNIKKPAEMTGRSLLELL